MRLFISLEVPPTERAGIHAALADLRARDLPVRWRPAEEYHVTLRFLGEVRPERADGMRSVLDHVASQNEPFDVGLGGVGGFPTLRRPRVIWFGVDAAPPLRCLKQDLEWALEERGIQREGRLFHPHITVGRAQRDVGPGPFRGLDGVVASIDYSGILPVRHLDLVRSRLGRRAGAGPRYSVVSRSPLAVDR